jgi:hypothetical protein
MFHLCQCYGCGLIRNLFTHLYYSHFDFLIPAATSRMIDILRRTSTSCEGGHARLIELLKSFIGILRKDTTSQVAHISFAKLNSRTLAMLGTTEKHTEGTTNSNALVLVLKKSMRWFSKLLCEMFYVYPVIHPFLAATSKFSHTPCIYS